MQAIENRLMDMEGRRGEEGEDEMYEESDMETYTTLHFSDNELC